MKDKDLKRLVYDKYSQIAARNEKSTCCCSGADKTEVYNIQTGDYSELKGYEQDADLGLGCGVPTKFAGLKPGDTVVDLGSGAGNDCFVARAEVGESGTVIGVDFSEAMIDKARNNAAKRSYSNVEFRQGDIEEMPVNGNSVDVVISNCVLNLLPSKDKIFHEIFRVLKPGGLLLNFDADYAANVRSESTQNCSVAPDSPYGHVGMTEALVEENNAITLALDVGQKRPAWDEAVLKKVGFSNCQTDLTVGQRVLGEADLVHAPMFGVFAQK